MLRRLRFSSCVPPPRPAASLALRTPFARMFANVIGGHELRANTNEQEMFIRLKADMCDDPAVDSNRVVSGVLSLAKCDPRLVVSDWPCHPDIEAAVDGWIADYCVFSPDAWTPRADILASFEGWERFDPDELSIALDARGITYRRKGNTHGFDGVRLRGGDND